MKTDYLKAKLVKALINHFGDDDRRIEHALEVTKWAERVGESEGGDPEVVLAVGLLHDVGIKEAEERHGCNNGKLQEQYGPPIVRRILEKIGFPDDKVAESCAIVGAHHTRDGAPGPNFPILWDADMIVNLQGEFGDAPLDRIAALVDRSFRTQTGRALARELFGIQPDPPKA